MSDLFDSTHEQKRHRLRQLHWTPAGKNLLGKPLWTPPNSSHSIEEGEAFAWLARHDIQGLDRED